MKSIYEYKHIIGTAKHLEFMDYIFRSKKKMEGKADLDL